MDDWYARNKGWFERQAIKYAGHACITAADNSDQRCREKYKMSRTEVGKLISRQTQHWNRGDWLHARVVEEVNDPSIGQASKADVLGVLTKRCGLGENLAKVVIRNLAPNMAQSTIRTIPPETAESTIQTIRPEMTESTIRTTLPETPVDSTIKTTPPEMAESTIRTIRPRMSESAIRTTLSDMADSTVQTIPPKATVSRNKHRTTSMSSDIIGLDYSPSRHKTIVLFGETRTGKSSLINLMACKEIAATSLDRRRCTMQWKEHTISFGGNSYTVFDTIGLEEPQLGVTGYLEAVENAYRLIKELDRRGGVDLLLFCVLPGRVTATMQSNYRLFNEFLCERKVPIVLVITHLEREQRMEDWWERNHSSLERYQIQVAGHACITTANRLDGRRKYLYGESRDTIRDLVEKFTADEQKQAWMGGDNLFASLMRKPKELLSGGSNVRKKDLVSNLMKRCGVSPDIAKQLAMMIRQDID
ncbi:hypothetical protein BDR05DRAFT_934925 [Suillus weaverae]|nr:hypothetical protein BDR05DRAFT_934925 [Suillus weaverae]